MKQDESKNELRFPCLRDLYPDRTTDEIRGADDALGRYLDVVIKIYRRHNPRPPFTNGDSRD